MIKTALEWVAWFAASVFIFVMGVQVGKDWGVEETRVITKTVEVKSGEFEDVPMIMESTMGNTFNLLCDFHFTPGEPEDSAECEYRD